MTTLLTLLRANKTALLIFIGLTALCSQHPFSFGILLLAYPILLYQGIQILRSWRLPEKRANKLTIILIVLVSVFVVNAIHSYREYSRQETGNRIIMAIEKFKLNHGRYPNSLAETGISEKNDDGQLLTKQTDERINTVYYKLYGNAPSLTYDASFGVGDYWFYNFTTHDWQFSSP